MLKVKDIERIPVPFKFIASSISLPPRRSICCFLNFL